MPDSIFSNQNPNMEDFPMEDVALFYGHLVYFTTIWHILWPFGIPSCWLSAIFSPVLVFCTKKNLATLLPC
jgi:hypothetical protein